jgi:RHH-type proline utilization regulon transcriptional repressor/proline dehydrogenase/delta 1-pyrroline-5-carboxylate dehydrogenase
MVGAVVGVNPFGGRGLSGTGPKAGGPNYLLQFSNCAPQLPNVSRDFELNQLPSAPTTEESAMVGRAHTAMATWHKHAIEQRISMTFRATAVMADTTVDGILREKLAAPLLLPGPTGEKNQLSLVARGVMLVIVQDSDTAQGTVKQIAAPCFADAPLLLQRKTITLAPYTIFSMRLTRLVFLTDCYKLLILIALVP